MNNVRFTIEKRCNRSMNQLLVRESTDTVISESHSHRINILIATLYIYSVFNDRKSS